MRFSSVMGTDNVVATSDQSTTQPLPGDRQKLEGEDRGGLKHTLQGLYCSVWWLI